MFMGAIRAMDLTAEHLRNILTYDPETGLWEWLPRIGNAQFGGPAGTLHPSGYVYICIDGRSYAASRLAWLYMTGEWPPRRVDHKDTVRSNNRWANFRLATHRQNLANAKMKKNSGFSLKGVGRSGSRKKPFRARFGGRHLGVFRTEEEANAEYFRAAQKAHGEFARG